MKPAHLFLPIFLSFYLFLSRCEVDVDTAACYLPQYRCGDDGYKISFPFWLPESMPDYCGSEGFELTCVSNETLMINISNESYQVKSIDYTTNVLTVVDPDLDVSDNQLCPKYVTNTTLNFSLFTYATFDLNLTFFSNCSLPSFLFPGLSPANCTGFGPNYYYSVNVTPSIYGGWQHSCSSVGVFAINQTAWSSFDGGMTGIGNVLQAGFGVNWLGTEWCDSCQSSGGVCGKNPGNSNAPNCFCSNGTVSSGTECVQQGHTSGTQTVSPFCLTFLF